MLDKSRVPEQKADRPALASAPSCSQPRGVRGDGAEALKSQQKGEYGADGAARGAQSQICRTPVATRNPVH